MIISHKHKFIFFKTRKTAGSSIQVELAKYCSQNDIITGQYRQGVDDNRHFTGLNMDKFYTNHPHPTLKETKAFLGNDIWDSYFKFAFVRNPFDIAVSRYFWTKKGKSNVVQETSIDDFKVWINGGLLSEDSLIQYTCDFGKIDLDFIGYYENLQNDYNFICSKIGLPSKDLPKLKSGYRDENYYTRYYDDTAINIVGKFYEKDLEIFDYKFNQKFKIRKLHPVIVPEMMKTGGDNINGPSLIKVPDWVENPLGKYYLYFGNHSGKYIRLAYSNNIEGPYTIYEPGTLSLSQTICKTHIASPDVHILEDSMIMYYHGDTDDGQKSFISISTDGINFETDNKVLGEFYFRVFKYKDNVYSIAKNKNEDSVIYQSDSYYGDFKKIFNILPNSRHTACMVDGNILSLFYTIIGESPESIYVCRINLDEWEVLDVELLTKPTEEYEGSKLPLSVSRPGSSTIYAGGPVRELRDPCIYTEGSDIYLLNSIKGELGITISKLYKLWK